MTYRPRLKFDGRRRDELINPVVRLKIHPAYGERLPKGGQRPLVAGTDLQPTEL